MKLTYGEIIGAVESLTKLKDKPLPARSSLNVARLLRKANECLQDFAVSRDGLKNKYSVEFKNENGGVQFTSEIEGNALKFANELNELLQIETELVFDKIKLPESLDFEPSIFVALEKFVEIS
jgi:hypothetical protein